MILNWTSDIIEIQTSSASVIDVVVNYSEMDSLSASEVGNQKTKIVTATTTTVLSAWSSSTKRRKIDSMFIKNIGILSNTINIKVDTGGTEYMIFSAVLTASEIITYSNEQWFSVYNSIWAIKTYSFVDALYTLPRQSVQILKTVSRVSIATAPFSVFDLAGNPWAGVLAGTSTTAGIVPTDATAGTPSIAAFSSGSGAIRGIEVTNSVASRIMLYDCLFKAWPYPFNANVTLASQPSFASRVPNGDYSWLEIWIEAVTAHTGNLSLNLGYTNEAGTSGRTPWVVALGVAPTIGRMIRYPFQSWDKGIQQLNSVLASVSTVGTFNVLILRPLGQGRVVTPWFVQRLGSSEINATIYPDSALFMVVQPDSTATGIPEVKFDIVW